jgi:hypothetical protein
MEIDLYGNRLKLENNEIYNYRKINQYGNNEWYKINFTLSLNGYLKCSLRNNKVKKQFTFHRLMYYFYNLDFDILNPKIQIDHINRDKLDNSIENLRVVTHQENQFNRDFKGYGFYRGKWRARIGIDGKRISLGYYDTEEEAREAYLEAKKKYHIINQNIV